MHTELNIIIINLKCVFFKFLNKKKFGNWVSVSVFTEKNSVFRFRFGFLIYTETETEKRDFGRLKCLFNDMKMKLNFKLRFKEQYLRGYLAL